MKINKPKKNEHTIITGLGDYSLGDYVCTTAVHGYLQQLSSHRVKVESTQMSLRALFGPLRGQVHHRLGKALIHLGWGNPDFKADTRLDNNLPQAHAACLSWMQI